MCEASTQYLKGDPASINSLPEIKEEAMCLCFEIKLCKLIDISNYSKCENMGPILITLLNAIHLFQLCT